MPNSQITLVELKPGDWGKVSGYGASPHHYRQKLLAMGLTPNAVFQVIRRAPLGDPIQIKVRNVYLSLRQGEAKHIQICRVVHDLQT